MSNQENKLHIPHENVAGKIKDCLMNTEQDILSGRIIQAYYNLKKANALIVKLQDNLVQKHRLQNQHTVLNNKLNSKILELIEKYGN